MYHWGKKTLPFCDYAGALSIPRKLKLVGDKIYNYPVKEAEKLLKKQSKYVSLKNDEIIVYKKLQKNSVFKVPKIESLCILEDTKSVEIFVNGGAISISEWII